ncbi:MAG: nucleotidyltransferase domain-containing protein [Chloroflexota bacterium]
MQKISVTTEPDKLIEKLAARLRPILARHQVLRAVVFGSLARKESSRRSDLDLILIQNTARRFLDRYDELLPEIGRAVAGRDIDLFIYTPQELAQIKHRSFIATALREGITIYESE